MRKKVITTAVMVGAGMLLFTGIHIMGADHDNNEKHLFVWAGDQARTNPDFLAVINFDERSRDYGRVITTAPLPGPCATWTEPHHVGLSADGRVLAAGGPLSVLKGPKEIFFLDVTDPGRPKFLTSADPPLSAITDEFYPQPEGGFLVTMMGGANGHAPGRVVEFDRNLKLIAEHPATPPEDGFNPHGISARPELNLMVTSDFICPSTTLHAVPGGLDLRGSVRVWDLRQRKILRTFDIPNSGGTIDVRRLIPGDSQPPPDLRLLASNPREREWVAELPFQYETLDSAKVIGMIRKLSGWKTPAIPSQRTFQIKLATAGGLQDVFFDLTLTEDEPGSTPLEILRRATN